MKKFKFLAVVLMVVVLFSMVFPMSAIALNAMHVYTQDFSTSKNGWFEFGTNYECLTLENTSLYGNSLCMTDHTKAWYSPAYDVFPLLQGHGEGTYWFEVKVKYTGTPENTANLSHLKIRGNGQNSFLTNDNGNYYSRISSYYTMNADMWYVMRGSLKVLESDLIASPCTKLYLCVDKVPFGTDVKLYIDDIKIYKMNNTQITNGDFSNELIGWRSFCSEGNDILNYDLDACAQYVRAKLHGSIATNVDQILSSYGSGYYQLDFDMSESHWDSSGCSEFSVYLSRGLSEYHYQIGVVDVSSSGMNHFTMKFFLDEDTYLMLGPDTNEVFLRFGYRGNANETIAYYLDNVSISRPLPTSGYEIDYDTSLWNGNIVAYTLCYTYALNDYYEDGDHVILVPGAASGYQYDKSDISASLIKNCLMEDAETLDFTCNEIGKYEKCSEGNYKIALVVAPGVDYHFYRQNPDGTWSHKRGGNAVTMVDASGNTIYDPEEADRNYHDSDGVNRNYSVFAGYYEVSPLKVS